jgi:hypothetical protein
VSRALIVARIADPEDRTRAMALALEKRWNGEGFQHSVRDLATELSRKRITMHLRAAPFDTEKENYYRFGPKDARGMQEPIALPTCGECPKRTGNCDPEADDPDVCTDTACFDAKAKLAAEHRRSDVAKSGRPVIRGAEAQKICPTKKVLIGYVDLDAVCKDDRYPEPEPEPSNSRRCRDEVADQAAYEAWDAKDRAGSRAPTACC